MKFLNFLSLFLIILILYFVNPLELDHQLFSITLPTNATLKIDISDIFIIVGVFSIFFEAVKSAQISTAGVYESTLSIIVSIAFLISFLLVQKAGTTTFLILMLMSFTEAISGFIISVSVARRDISASQNII